MPARRGGRRGKTARAKINAPRELGQYPGVTRAGCRLRGRMEMRLPAGGREKGRAFSLLIIDLRARAPNKVCGSMAAEPPSRTPTRARPDVTPFRRGRGPCEGGLSAFLGGGRFREGWRLDGWMGVVGRWLGLGLVLGGGGDAVAMKGFQGWVEVSIIFL